MPQSKAAEAAREERRKQVAANLVAGLTYREMSQALNCSIGTIAGDVKIILGRWKREQVTDAAEYVTLELRRIDLAINAIWQKITNGDLAAIDRLVKLQERRARYMGIDKPQEYTLTDDELIKQYQELRRQLDEITEPTAEDAADAGGSSPEDETGAGEEGYSGADSPDNGE